jgi:uncharacterized protein DUF4375
MSQLPWLTKYSGETTSELVALEATYRKDSIVVAFEQALGQKSFRLGGSSFLTKEERVVLAVEALEREVNNGGYDLFFLNSSVEFVTEIVSALERIGRSDVASVTQRAIHIGMSGGRSGGNILGLNGVETLDLCDSEYFQIAGDLAEPLFEFIKQAQEHITLP